MQDVEVLDSRLPGAIMTFINAAIQALMIVAVAVYVTPPMIFILVPVNVFYYYILVSMRLSNRLVKLWAICPI